MTNFWEGFEKRAVRLPALGMGLGSIIGGGASYAGARHAGMPTEDAIGMGILGATAGGGLGTLGGLKLQKRLVGKRIKSMHSTISSKIQTNQSDIKRYMDEDIPERISKYVSTPGKSVKDIKGTLRGIADEIEQHDINQVAYDKHTRKLKNLQTRLGTHANRIGSKIF